MAWGQSGGAAARHVRPGLRSLRSPAAAGGRDGPPGGVAGASRGHRRGEDNALVRFTMRTLADHSEGLVGDRGGGAVRLGRDSTRPSKNRWLAVEPWPTPALDPSWHWTHEPLSEARTRS